MRSTDCQCDRSDIPIVLVENVWKRWQYLLEGVLKLSKSQWNQFETLGLNIKNGYFRERKRKPKEFDELIEGRRASHFLARQCLLDTIRKTFRHIDISLVLKVNLLGFNILFCVHIIHG